MWISNYSTLDKLVLFSRKDDRVRFHSFHNIDSDISSLILVILGEHESTCLFYCQKKSLLAPHIRKLQRISRESTLSILAEHLIELKD